MTTSQDITLELQTRETIRKGLATLRTDGQVPAVIHDHGKASMHVMGEYVAMSKVFSLAGKHHPVQLKLDGKQHLALIKDVDVEPTKHRLRHIVFQAIKQNEKVSAEIPVVLVGEDIPAEKKSLLILKQLDHVEVLAFPRDLPDQLTVDATTLAEVGDHLTVADLKVPEGVEVTTDPEMQIAIVEMPKDQVAAADEAQAELLADAGLPSDAEEQVVETPQSEAEEQA